MKTQNFPSCHLLKQTSQAPAVVDLACQTPVQIPRTGCETHESTWTSHAIPTRKQLYRVPALQLNEKQRSILARFQIASTKWSCATLRNAMRRGAASTDWEWLAVSGVSRSVTWTDVAATFRLSDPLGGFGICCSGRMTP